MSKRIAVWMTVLSCLAAWTVWAADASPAALNALHDLTTTTRNGTVVVQVTGNYPIMDYTYYDYDPETFVVDMADVDVSALPKTMAVNKDGVRNVKVESISHAKGRALAKLEIHKAYLAKCIVSTEGNKLLVRVVGAGSPPPAEAASATQPARKTAPVPAKTTPPKPAVAEPAAAAQPLPDADRLLSVDVAQDGSAVDIKADGTPKYKYFTMKNPDRIVVDLLGVRKGRVPNHVEGAGAIQRVRIGIHKNDPPVTRVVLDMKKAISPVSVDSSGASVVVRLNADTRRASTDEATKPESAGPKRAPSPEMAQAKTGTQPAPAPVVAKAKPAGQTVAKNEKPGESKPNASGLDKVKVDLSPIKPGASKEFKGYQDLFVAQNSESKSAEGKTVSGGAIPLSFKEKTISGEGVKYTGEPISLSLKDADIKDVLRMFHDISGMNIVVHPGVQGKVTVDLTNVPWDQAMDIILKNNGLDYIYENNVIWVAPAAEIARKFAEQQRLQKEKLLAEAPVTFIKRLSYAKATSMAAIAGKFLSERGHIIVDPRTNSLIIQEVPSKKASLLKLIDSLDTATPQVLIEARIVETSITWSQSFGITWSGNWYSGLDSSGNLNTTHGGATGAGPAGTSYTLHNFGNTSGWPNVGQGDFAVTLPPSASNGFIDLVLGNTTGSFFLDVKLAALENTGRGRVLSAPRIVTQDNQKATIESGRQIPIRVATTDKISVIFVNATLKLDVTPQISADGNVNMTVDITNDSVDFANQEPGNPPPIIKKEAKTVLKVHDGQTAVIGGVFVTNEGVSQNGLPFLSKIPVLGWLFKNRTKSRSNDELLIFLTPKIIR